MTIQEKLIEAIQNHKIIMEDLANKTDLSRKGIYNALNSQQNIGFRTLNKIGAEVGLELTWCKSKDKNTK